MKFIYPVGKENMGTVQPFSCACTGIQGVSNPAAATAKVMHGMVSCNFCNCMCPVQGSGTASVRGRNTNYVRQETVWP